MPAQTRRTKTRPQTTRRPATRTKTRVAPRLAPIAQTTALVRRPPVEPLAPVTLGDAPTSGVLGAMAARFTPDQEAVLKRPVDPARLLVKPTGEVYLSHIDYTRWFNDAFGMGMWALVPVSKPVKTDTGVGCHYHLFVHGIPRAWALGEQEYFEKNKRQTWGEALESTNASGLRRCAKRLGVGLELWDKRYLNAFLTRDCLKVRVLDRDQEAWWYRRRDDPPFWQEEKAQRASHGQPMQARPERPRPAPPRPASPGPMVEPRPAPPPRPERPAPSRHPHENAVISDPQRKRLFTIAKKHSRTEQEIKSWLLKAYKIGSTRDLTRRDYDAVISAIEAAGPLGGVAQTAATDVKKPEVLTADDIPWGQYER